MNVMKLINILPLALSTSAFVIPDEHVMSQVAIESHQVPGSLFDHLPTKSHIIDTVKDTFSDIVGNSRNAFDQAVEFAESAGKDIWSKSKQTSFEAESWLASEFGSLDHHGHHCPHHGHDGQKPNKTVYELIAENKYTTKLAALINEYEDLVTLLNGTAANYTIFAPIDSAFDRIPEHAPKPSKEEIKRALLYHISSEFYPAGRVLVTHTIPSSLAEEDLGGELQRLSTNIGLRGLTVNFYSRIIAVDFFGTNGVVHGVDRILVPPPNAVDIIGLLPGEFSTLELGLAKTGLIDILNDTSKHIGGTLFAPSNFAFKWLGYEANAFLFSSRGEKYLRCLLLYHVVANQTLYSDAYYKADRVGQEDIPKGVFHIDLQTLFQKKTLSVDVGRYGRFISIKINGFTQVTIEDGIAKDGVIQVVSSVLIPPKHINGVEEQWQGQELTEEELIERLEPFVEREEL